MTDMLNRHVAWLACSMLLTWASRGHAQELPAWLKVRASYLAYEAPAEPRAVEPARRGPGYLLAAGAGMAIGGAALAVVQGSKSGWCYEHERVRFALPIGLALTGVGLAMGTVGGVKLVRSKPGRVGPLHGVLMAVTAAATLIPSFMIPLYANPYTYRCI
ncbi:MAG: hypothetical protein JWN48_1872 [Myxococcaceae bacterium]|nr:hypothetical protein [Myxococcaceae bacterium]